VASYVAWVDPPRTHAKLFNTTLLRHAGDPCHAFGDLYHSMNVRSFGRMARFDYLTMISKVGVASLEPGSTFMDGATGPFDGARLLFGISSGKRVSRADLDAWLVELAGHLKVGMQVMEDAVCNWQKSPNEFVAFRA
jgi:hypothetical protein